MLRGTHHSEGAKKKISLARRESSSWKGGVSGWGGYIFIYYPSHPRARSNGYVKRAILVLEQKLGRPLLEGMDSHHKNGIKDDDRPENLEEKTHGGHMALHKNARRVKEVE